MTSFDFFVITALEIQLSTKDQYEYLTYNKQGHYVYSDSESEEYTNTKTRDAIIEVKRNKIESIYEPKILYENGNWLTNNKYKCMIYKSMLDKNYIKLGDIIRIIKVKYTSLPL